VKFVVGTYGTKGDARPFAALCRGLIDAGHEARLLADADRFGSAQALSVHTTALGAIFAALSVQTMPSLAPSRIAAGSTHRKRAGEDRQ
jgi:UDP:flavonoid glycosyltransferase YjiC (YdhE family)